MMAKRLIGMTFLSFLHIFSLLYLSARVTFVTFFVYSHKLSKCYPVIAVADKCLLLVPLRLCAIYTPETYFKWDEAQQHEVVANIPGIPRARLELRCIFCRSTKGACFQCSSKKCARAYHATCAAAAGVLVNMFDVPHYGEDGQIYPQTDIDFRCRFHRPKRPKGMDSEKLENDMVVRKFANSLIKGDVIQMQYYRGDIFGGVVIENRYSEECVVVNVLPKGSVANISWFFCLFFIPSFVLFHSKSSF